MTDRFPALSETFVTGEIAQLARLGHDVTVEALTRSDRPDWEAAAGMSVHFADDEKRRDKLGALAWLVTRHPLGVARDLLARRRWRAQERVRPLRALAVRARRLHDAGIDLVHVHFAAGAALEAMRSSALAGVPYSLTPHAYDIFAAPTNLREKMERAAFVTSGCDYNVHHLRTLVRARVAPRIHKIVMGVDGERFHRLRPYPGGRGVLAVGRLVEKKGFADLIDAVGQLEQRDPVDRLEIIGDGPLRFALLERAERAGVPHRVEFSGARSPEEIRQRLERADVLAMPCVVAPDGDRDSMPVVVKEAMAMEVPVIATREVGLPELVARNRGRLAPPGDPHGLARALGELLDRPAEDRASLGRSGREHVLAHCDQRAETARLAELMRSAAAAGR